MPAIDMYEEERGRRSTVAMSKPNYLSTLRRGLGSTCIGSKGVGKEYLPKPNEDENDSTENNLNLVVDEEQGKNLGADLPG
jgi:hypothetical protein